MVDGEPEEWGQPNKQGKRTDLQDLRELAVAGASDLEMGAALPSAHARFYKWAAMQREQARALREKERLAEEFADWEPRLWQGAILERLEAQSSRSVTWIVDVEGGAGKSQLAEYLAVTKNAFVVTNGKQTDIAYAYNDEPVVVFDWPRDVEDRVPYGLVEMFKNGRIFVGKYESRTRIFKRPKVLVLTNFMPEIGKLSADRWDIHELLHSDANDEWVLRYFDHTV